MSAFIVDRATVDALADAIVETGIAPGSSKDGVGRVLWRRNLMSVAYRYPKDADGQWPGPTGLTRREINGYTWTPPVGGSPSAGVIRKYAECYDYQSCEHPDYQASMAKGWIDKLLALTEPYRDTTEYHGAYWGGGS